MKFAIYKKFHQIVTISILVLLALPAMAADNKPSGEKAAVVNGVVITGAHYEKELKLTLEYFSRQGRQIPDEQLPELKKRVLDKLIEREILYQESQKAGIKADEQRVNDQMVDIKKRYKNDEEFKKDLANRDVTEEELRTQFQRASAIRELVNQKVANKIVVTDEETKAYYDGNIQRFKQPEQVRASHILIKVEPTADDAAKAAARKKIDDIRQKLTDGGDFAELAKEYSEGPSGPKGGDLGYFRRGQMVKPFDDTAFSMKTSEVSGVVETRFGYHLIKVYDKKPEQTMAYADVKENIAQGLKQEKVGKSVSEYNENLKKDAKIEKFL